MHGALRRLFAVHYPKQATFKGTESLDGIDNLANKYFPGLTGKNISTVPTQRALDKTIPGKIGKQPAQVLLFYTQKIMQILRRDHLPGFLVHLDQNA
jgi:hypothetical protein